MKINLLERLRSKKAFYTDINHQWHQTQEPDIDCQEAANHIENLERRIVELQGYINQYDSTLDNYFKRRDEINAHYDALEEKLKEAK